MPSVMFPVVRTLLLLHVVTASTMLCCTEELAAEHVQIQVQPPWTQLAIDIRKF